MSDETPLTGLHSPTDAMRDTTISERAASLQAGFGDPPIKAPEAKLAEDRAMQMRVADAMQAAQGDLREIMTANTPAPDGKDALNEVRVAVTRAAAERNAEVVGRMLEARDNAAGALTEDLERKLVDYVQAHFDLSYEKISKRYDFWKQSEQVHDLYITAEAASASQSKSKRRQPLLVDTIMTPYTRAISDTTCTYNLAIFGGSPPFRIEALGSQANRKGAKIMELELAQTMRRVGYEAKLYQMMLDRNRYGMAPMAIFWGADGNTPLNLDPWSCFPDPRVTAQNRHEADFFGYRTWATLSALRRRKLYDPVKLEELVNSKPRASWQSNKYARDLIRGQSIDFATELPRDTGEKTSQFKLGFAHILNTLWVFLDPKELGIPAAFGLYRIVVADEGKVILFDKTPFSHGQIPIVIGDGEFDAHKTFSSGLHDRLAALQRFQDWLLRTRVENVQSIVQSRLIVDPSKINVNDILNPNAARLIRTLPGADPRGAVLPVETNDVTQRYWQDLDTAGQLMQRLEAASDQAQGVQSDTARTATEVARITSLGQQRLGSQARLLSAMTIRPAVMQMIDNIKYFGIRGGEVRLPPEFGGNGDFVTWGLGDIEGRYDYQVVDGTLPTDPRENSDSIIRAIRVLSETGLAAEWDMKRWVEAALQGMGFSNLEEFRLSPKEAQQRAALATQALNGVASKVVDDRQIEAQRQAGNIVPLNQVMPTPSGQPNVVPSVGA